MNEYITPELMKQAETAGSPEEILALAKEHGIELPPEEAQACYDRFHKTGELADDELDAVSGGGCHSTKKEELMYSSQTCNNCQSMGSIQKSLVESTGGGYKWVESCANCGYFQKIEARLGSHDDVSYHIVGKGIEERHKRY